MPWFIFLFGAVTGVIGWFLYRHGVLANLTLSLVAGLAVAALVGPSTWGIATNIMKNEEQTFQEFWGGYEQGTGFATQACERDGWCQNEYDCDHYVYTWTTTDSEGKTTTHSEIRSHDCPYSSEETTYTIDTTLGGYTVGTYMTGPEYRAGTSIPGGQVTEPPAVWSAAKARVDAGQPGGVFEQNSYKNYLHASETSILKHYSADIEAYQADGLLLPIGKDLHSIYQMDKAQFPGNPSLNDATREQLATDAMYLSAALGTELQGDLRLVFVNGNKVRASEAEKYGLALMAHWQSKAMGKFAIPKNAVVVIVGVGGTSANPTATWTRAYTGMPVGNERLTVGIKSALTGMPIDENFLGRPTLLPGAESVTQTGGVLEDVLFGPHKFERVSMSGVEEGDIGSGFEYLGAGWEPDSGQQTFIYILSFIFSLLLIVPLGFLCAATYTGPRKYALLVDPVGMLADGHRFGEQTRKAPAYVEPVRYTHRSRAAQVRESLRRRLYGNGRRF